MKFTTLKAIAFGLICLVPNHTTALEIHAASVTDSERYDFRGGGYFILEYGIKDVDGAIWVCGKSLNRTTGVVNKLIEDLMTSLHIRVNGKTVYSDVMALPVSRSTRRQEVTDAVCFETDIPYPAEAKLSVRMDGNVPQFFVQRMNGRKLNDQ